MASNRVGLLRIKLVSRGKNQTTNNSSEFNAVPEGGRGSDGSFNDEGFTAIFWTSSENENDTSYVWDRNLDINPSNLVRNDRYKEQGFSVRFVRD